MTSRSHREHHADCRLQKGRCGGYPTGPTAVVRTRMKAGLKDIRGKLGEGGGGDCPYTICIGMRVR